MLDFLSRRPVHSGFHHKVRFPVWQTQEEITGAEAVVSRENDASFQSCALFPCLQFARMNVSLASTSWGSWGLWEDVCSFGLPTRDKRRAGASSDFDTRSQQAFDVIIAVRHSLYWRIELCDSQCMSHHLQGFCLPVHVSFSDMTD